MLNLLSSLSLAGTAFLSPSFRSFPSAVFVEELCGQLRLLFLGKLDPNRRCVESIITCKL